MSKPISNIKRLVVNEETKKQRDLEEIETALADNKEAILETVDLIRHLHERGTLEFLNGLFSQGDEVFSIIVDELNQPNNSRVLENFVGLAGILGSIDVEQLKVMANQMNNGLREAAATEEAGDDGPRNIFQLMKALKDPEINRSVSMLLGFLKGMGKE